MKKDIISINYTEFQNYIKTTFGMNKMPYTKEISEGTVDIKVGNEKRKISANLYRCIRLMKTKAVTNAIRGNKESCDMYDVILHALIGACTEWNPQSLNLKKKWVTDYLTSEEIKVAKMLGYSVKSYETEKALSEQGNRIRKLIEDESREHGVDNIKDLIRALKKEQKKREEFEKWTKDNKCDWEAVEGINLGVHNEGWRVVESQHNGVSIKQRPDWNCYAKSFRFPATVRSGTLLLKKGYKVQNIEGKITFVKGEINSDEVTRVEWITQGRAISDVDVVKGYLYKGMHYMVKTKEEALKKAEIASKIQEEIDAKLMLQRKMVEEQYSDIKGITVTFDDSIKSGNCRPGTMKFIRKVERLLKREVRELPACDVLIYARRFDVEYNALCAIRYAINNRKSSDMK